MSHRISRPVPISLQLYSVRDDLKLDFEGAAGEIANIGYRHVELAGYADLDTRRVAAILRSAGLAVSGMHVGIAQLRENVGRVADDARLFGTPHVVVPWWSPDELISAANGQRIGEELNALGATLRKEGLRLSFHNHAVEFRIFEERPIFDWILSAAEPRNLGAELDVGWAHTALYSPPRFLYEQGARISLIHLKDGAEIGSGPVSFDEVFAAADNIGVVEYYVVEFDEVSQPPLEAARISFNRLRDWGKV